MSPYVFWIWPVALVWFLGFRRWGWHGNEARAQWESKRRRKLRRAGWTPDDDDEGESSAPVRLELDDQRDTIQNMEARIAELENRLDFAERLLAGNPAEAGARTNP
ncbi:MAG: hypothetical protein ABI679_05165 [Gemmatimonadota bacterium]